MITTLPGIAQYGIGTITGLYVVMVFLASTGGPWAF